jgi:hypothetical protein
MINKNILQPVFLAFIFGCTKSLSAEPPICSSARPVAEWSSCRGLYDLWTGDNYNGEFHQGSFDGLGRFTTRLGVIFVGQFERGTRSGYGIEYASTGEVIRQGLWRGSLVREEAIDPSLFPRFGELRFEVVKQWASSDPKRRPVSLDEASGLKRDLAAAKERIKTLEAELARARRAPKSSTSDTGLSLVTKCLQEGFRPGTPEFSKCIASEGAVP